MGDSVDEIMGEWDSLSTLIENTRAMGHLNARNLAIFSDRIDQFLRRWTESAARGDERLWKILEQAGPALKAKLSLGLELTRQQGLTDLARKRRIAEIESRIEQTTRETEAIYEQNIQAQRQASEERNQAWMRVNFPQRYCPQCHRQFQLPHHFCSHCRCGSYGFSHGF